MCLILELLIKAFQQYGYIVLNEKMILNDMEAVAAYFKVLYKQFSRETGKKKKKYIYISANISRNANPGHAKCEAGIPTTKVQIIQQKV
jgi:hypothetical protein